MHYKADMYGTKCFSKYIINQKKVPQNVNNMLQLVEKEK